MFSLAGRPIRIAVTAMMLGLAFQTVGANAAQRHDGGDRAGFATEAQREPRGYMRLERPTGAEIRPQSLDREGLNHNFQAQRGFHIGPYHAPDGWQYRQWRYGQILPSTFWARQYWLSDYWLFGLDIPSTGFEWVRYGPDAILVNMMNGEIVQVIYGSFL